MGLVGVKRPFTPRCRLLVDAPREGGEGKRDPTEGNHARAEREAKREAPMSSWLSSQFSSLSAAADEYLQGETWSNIKEGAATVAAATSAAAARPLHPLKKLASGVHHLKKSYFFVDVFGRFRHFRAFSFLVVFKRLNFLHVFDRLWTFSGGKGGL